MNGFGKRKPSTEAQQSEGDNRTVDRTPVYRNARVMLSDGTVIKCVARNISAKGCLIVGDGVENLPQALDITIDTTARYEEANVTWRKKGQAGISFT